MKRAGRGLVTAACIVALLVAACGSSDDDAAAPEEDEVAANDEVEEPGQRTVTSEDGNVIVEVPASAADVDVEVRLLEVADYPEELQDAEVRGGLYELLPDGATFDEPVRVTRVLDAAVIGLAENEVASMIMATRSSDGEWSLLDDVVIERTPDEYTVSGSTSHFSTLAAFRSQITVALDPPSVERAVGEDFDVAVVLTEGTGVAHADSVRFSVDPLLRVVTDADELSAQRESEREDRGILSCVATGTGSYFADGLVEEDIGEFARLTGGVFPVPSHSFHVRFRGTATCLADGEEVPPPPSPQPGSPFDIVSACARIIDEPFLDFPVTAEMWIFLQGADGAEGSLTVTGLNDDQPTSATVENGAAIFRLGLRDRGLKTVTDATLARPGEEPTDVTDQVTALIGSPMDIQDPSFESGNGC